MSTLVLEIEYLTGVAYAAQGPDRDLPDWPPQPDRVFSALVAAWGARGENPREKEALEWLERLSVPKIAAAEMSPRTAPASFVPPNDPETGRSGNRAVLPAYRPRQSRRFPSARLKDPIVRLAWEDTAADAETFEALRSLAADVAYVGHSASLTRCYFQQMEALPSLEWQQPLRRIYKGRFEELRRNYASYLSTGGRVGRPAPGAPVPPPAGMQEDSGIQSCFAQEWLLLEHVGGTMPDIRATALIAKTLRDALLSGYRQIGKANSIPFLVSGHEADGAPTRENHLAIAPLSASGYGYADGHVLGFALIPPKGSRLFEDPDFLEALFQICQPVGSGKDQRSAPSEQRRVLNLYREDVPVSPRLRGFDLQLSPTFTPDLWSMRPHRYTKAAKTFATITPIVLDRHLKAKAPKDREDEIAEQIKAACRNIGLPEPNSHVSGKHSAVEGAVSAQPSGKSPSWLRWRVPESLASRSLVHAVIRFPQKVSGPVILGAGRFVGLGLCLPLDEGEVEG